ncbi:hypothetical protein ACFE04_008477 [Oxalis oulophora]
MKPKLDDDNEDRFTSLPNHLSHHILSFLTIEQIVPLSLASKKCQNLCLTVPILAIEDYSKNGDECQPKRVRFLDYLVTFIERRKCAKLTKLIICWGITGLPFKETVLCYVKLWLTEIYEMDIFKISSQSLQELEIVSCNLDYLEISAQSLKTLNLIKALDLSNPSSCNVYAPNLLILSCSGNCIEYLTLEKTESKYSASLILPEAYLSKTDELKSLLSSLVQVTELSIDHLSLQSVRLHNGFENISVPAIGHFLQGLSHNLNKLHMDHYLGAEAEIAYWSIDGCFGYREYQY